MARRFTPTARYTAAARRWWNSTRAKRRRLSRRRGKGAGGGRPNGRKPCKAGRGTAPAPDGEGSSVGSRRGSRQVAQTERPPTTPSAAVLPPFSARQQSADPNRPHPLSLVPHTGGDRRAIRCRKQRARLRPLRGFLPLQQRARSQGAQTPARRALRPDNRRDSRHLSGGAARCADPHVHSRRLLALAEQQGIQLRGRGFGRGRRDSGDQQLRALPGGQRSRRSYARTAPRSHGSTATPRPSAATGAASTCRDIRPAAI